MNVEALHVRSMRALLVTIAAPTASCCNVVETGTISAIGASWGEVDVAVVERAGVPSYTEAMRLLAACEARVWQQGQAS
jgi:hypothetical protein